MKNLIQDTLKKIETQHIAPEPRWRCSIRKYGLWMIFWVVLILGAISFSVAFDNSSNLDWDLYQFMHQSQLAYFLSVVPYFWIILIAIFSIVAFFEIRRTETGYRYSWLKIFMITFGGILMLWVFMFFLGFGGKFNSLLKDEVPFYGRHMVVTKESQWMQPAKGFLAGTIISASEKKLEINDLDGNDWNIDIDDKTLIKPSVDIYPEETIKIIGTKVDEDNFKAEEIRPWVGRGMGNGRNGKMMDGGGNRGGMMQGK